ncbi:uncharacterized protein LOC111987334 [Quercus suber]|uniref:uncharacterized protein LOC111987334 n=1 Tax=Quercus suber TaxID=58331 RepID=UPI000CE1F0D8|nr:uncharacterized protein LOC111987334 [Quercus suber]
MQASSLPFNQLYQDMRVRLNEYQLAQKPPIPEFMTPGETRWYLPQSLQHKVNYDGALFKEIWQAGIGVVIKDATGRVCGALSDRIVLPRTVEEAEAIACRTVVRFALELGLEEVVFEGDSETITTAINSTSACFSSFSHILDDVKALALNFASATFVHVKRQGNAVADKLAKASKCIPCPHFWSNGNPSDVQQLVIHDSIP